MRSKFLTLFSFPFLAGVAAQAESWTVPERVEVLLDHYCYSCHDEDTQKGEIRLDHLGGREREGIGIIL